MKTKPIPHTINSKWHEKNRMPANPTFEQRMKWHIEHAKYCSCRPLTGKLLEEVNEFKMSSYAKHRNIIT